MGYGSALAVILFAFGLVLALAYQRFVLRRDVEGAVTAFNGWCDDDDRFHHERNFGPARSSAGCQAPPASSSPVSFAT